MLNHPIGNIEGSREVIEDGRRVVLLAADALSRMADSLDQKFADAVALLIGVPGRIVVTGMGKSGHIARKVASTLASTGSPALFVHPAEAAHGDLGMMVSGDVLLVFSNSGETEELGAILNHAKRLKLGIIGVASKAGSALMRDADIGLLLPPSQEACKADLAPTTSTTLMLALGDALAIAAQNLRGMSREGFGALHPGGMIGQRLMPVSAFMHEGEKLPLVPLDLPMRDVLLVMTAKSFGVAGVVDGEGDLVGIVTDGDLRRNAASLLDLSAREVLTAEPVTILRDMFVEDALALFTAKKITTLFVTDSQESRRPVGILHVHDLLRRRIL